METQQNHPSEPAGQQWNAELYDGKHSFVSHYGADLLQLLQPKTGDRILDLGCGTGYLTQQIAASGAISIGVDSSASMIEKARQTYPTLQFEIMDGETLPFYEDFDAVFSNAALHWMKQAEKVAVGVYRSLKPGGKFIAEFGGKGNIHQIFTACIDAIQAAGYPADRILNPWYFPSIGEYATLLEKQGFEVNFATLFERPTPLEDGEQGLQNWIKMFGDRLFDGISDEVQNRIMQNVENRLRSQLYQNGTWFADYKRIRIMAQK